MPNLLIRASLLVLVLSATLVPLGAQKHSSSERILRGVVFDQRHEPVVGAVVHLKNVPTHMTRIYLTDQKGGYYFRWMEAGAEYEVQATRGKLSSEKHAISATDNLEEIDLTLEDPSPKK
jgi:hypothetical protein